LVDDSDAVSATAAGGLADAEAVGRVCLPVDYDAASDCMPANNGGCS